MDTDRRIERARERVSERFEVAAERADAEYPPAFYGSFVAESRKDGKIELAKEDAAVARNATRDLRRAAPLLPSLMSGIKIAAEYDIRTHNFSTQTRIVTLADGRKLFAVHAYASSAVHRLLDGLSKWAAGLRMQKVSRREWKRAFEEKSNIPVVACDEPDVVLLPFLPNVNAYDLFANNHEIQDFGAYGWAKEAVLEKKRELTDRIVDELRRVHAQGKAWGEMILPNVILLEDQRPAICDPEVRYDDGVDFVEAKARDLKDLAHSVAGALARSEGEPVEETVRRILDRYGNPTVVATLQGLVDRKRGLLERLVFPYEKVRSGATDEAEYERVRAAIRAYTKSSV